MNEEKSSSKIAEALGRAQGEFTRVAKNKTAKVRTKTGGEYSYSYADLADVLQMVLPVLSKHGLALTQPLMVKDGRQRLTTRLLHISGEVIESDGIVLPENLPAQELGAQLTYFRRYDLCSLLAIAPDEDVDAVGSRLAGKAVASSTSTNTDVISDSQRKNMFALARENNVNHEALKSFLRRAFGITSSKEITTAMFPQIVNWVTRGSEELGITQDDVVAVMGQNLLSPGVPTVGSGQSGVQENNQPNADDRPAIPLPWEEA